MSAHHYLIATRSAYLAGAREFADARALAKDFCLARNERIDIIACDAEEEIRSVLFCLTRGAVVPFAGSN